MRFPSVDITASCVFSDRLCVVPGYDIGLDGPRLNWAGRPHLAARCGVQVFGHPDRSTTRALAGSFTSTTTAGWYPMIAPTYTQWSAIVISPLSPRGIPIGALFHW